VVMPEEIRESAGSEAAQPMVLVVDDDVETLWALQRALRSEPYTVLATDDPFRALEWVKSRDVGLVITDEFMPAMLGTQLLEAVRHVRPDIATMLLTGFPKPDVMFRGFQQRVDLMLAKPWEGRALREATLHLLRERMPRSERETSSCGSGPGPAPSS